MLGSEDMDALQHALLTQLSEENVLAIADGSWDTRLGPDGQLTTTCEVKPSLFVKLSDKLSEALVPLAAQEDIRSPARSPVNQARSLANKNLSPVNKSGLWNTLETAAPVSTTPGAELSTPQKSSVRKLPTPIGYTPLNVIKRNHLNRIRIMKLNAKLEGENPELQEAVRTRLSIISEEGDTEPSPAGPLHSAMAHVVYDQAVAGRAVLDRAVPGPRKRQSAEAQDAGSASKKARRSLAAVASPVVHSSPTDGSAARDWSAIVRIGSTPDTTEVTRRSSPRVLATQTHDVTPVRESARPRRLCSLGLRFSADKVERVVPAAVARRFSEQAPRLLTELLHADSSDSSDVFRSRENSPPTHNEEGRTAEGQPTEGQPTEGPPKDEVFRTRLGPTAKTDRHAQARKLARKPAAAEPPRPVSGAPPHSAASDPDPTEIVSAAAGTAATDMAPAPSVRFANASLLDLDMGKNRGSAGIFAARTGGRTTNPYRSRASLTAKMKRTRERRVLRAQQNQELYAETGAIRQQTRRERRYEGYRAQAETRYLASTADGDGAEDRLARVIEDRADFARELAEEQGEEDGSPFRLPFERLLRALYGFANFRPYQEQALAHVVRSRRPLLLCMRTGAGKSLVFFLAGAYLALQQGAMAAMVLPTKALVNDQVAAATRVLGARFTVAALHSGLDPQSYAATFKALRGGLLDFLFTTPEQFTSLSLAAALRQASRPLGLLCLDEAHCMSEWSHSFRPAYQLVVPACRKHFREAKMLLMTATVTKETHDSIAQIVTYREARTEETSTEETSTEEARTEEVRTEKARTEDAKTEEGRTEEEIREAAGPVGLQSLVEPRGYERPDLRPQIRKGLSEGQAAAWIGDEVRRQRRGLEAALGGSGTHLVFVWMKHEAESVCRSFQDEFPDCRVCFYHSGVSETEKQRILDQLLAGRLDVLVATQAMGLGIDVHHIRRVYHLCVPGSIEQWVQEVGRCNRDGAESVVPVFGVLSHAHYWKKRQRTAANVVDEFAVRRFMRLFVNPDAG
ncbi:ATP-dependent DNA helicase, partial [Gregarina niphandrodes]